MLTQFLFSSNSIRENQQHWLGHNTWMILALHVAYVRQTFIWKSSSLCTHEAISMVSMATEVDTSQCEPNLDWTKLKLCKTLHEKNAACE